MRIVSDIAGAEKFSLICCDEDRPNHPLGAAVARSPERSVGGRRRRRRVAHPLGGPEHRKAASQFKPGFVRCVTAALQLRPLLLPSVHSMPPSSRCRPHVLADALLQERLPGHELETEPVVDHGEASADGLRRRRGGH